MTPENQTSEHEENQLNPIENTDKNQADMDTETSVTIAEEKVQSEVDPAENKTAPEQEIKDDEPQPEHQADVDTEASVAIPEEKVLSEIDPEKASDEAGNEYDLRSLEELLADMESATKDPKGIADSKKFNKLKEAAQKKMDKETSAHKSDEASEDNTWEHPQKNKLKELTSVFREKHDAYLREQEKEHSKNLEHRQEIIEKLKSLYTNTEPGTNLFKAIREIKEMWTNAGQVAKAEFKLLNNNYFHHLNQFYAMLDMNKEYLEQEYAHNLEKRQHIIARAKELESESVVQKALNELQYLHKLWKEEAEPVAEEFREKTWDEFKEISNSIHARKSELNAVHEAEQAANLEKKNGIIAEIVALAAPAGEITHSYWQQAIKKVEELREEFLKTGSVPRKESNQNWNDFKETLRNFNTTKNDYYKNLKNSQFNNLQKKQELIQTAKDNMNSDDWETALPLFKKIQEEWKTVGHVPRNQANKMWEEFRAACNVFFDNYRVKNNAVNDNWKENYKGKLALLEELKTITDEEGSIEKIEEIKGKWNAIGKVPKDKLNINTEFNKTLRDKLRLNKINEFDLKDDNLSEAQTTDKARKMKNQIGDLEAEIAKMENNLGFFGKNVSRDNPLLKDTFERIDEKKAQLESLKQNLHSIIAGE